MEQKTCNSRIVWIDILRIIAIISVIICHVSERFYFLEGDISQQNIPQQILGFGIFSIGRVGGVPIFLMITGYLLLNRNYDNEGIKKFYKRNLLPLLIASELWIVLFHLFDILFFKTPFSIKELMKSMLFFSEADGYLWYIPLIIGIYVFLPFVATVLQKVDIKYLMFAIALVVFYQFVCPFIGGIRDYKLSLSFSGGIYGLYVIIGGLFAKGAFTKTKKIFWAIGALLSFGITVGYQFYMSFTGTIYPVWYDFIFLMICGVCIFGFFNNLNIKEEKYNWAKKIADLSFGMYLIHMIWIYVMIRYIPLDGISIPLRVMLLVIITFVGSYFSINILSRIPKVGRVLFLVKR